MHYRYTPEQQALRAELRQYFTDLMTPEIRAALRAESAESGNTARNVMRRMGADGWLGVGWPVEYGGRGLTGLEQFVFFDEVQRAGAPFPFVTVNTVGPTLMQYGSQAQKDTYLPGILNGEINFAIGYTEPEAGTDLANLRTRAVRDGDEWVIDGNKVFTSGADRADYVWLACRTDVDAPKHKGISIIIVPTSAPGFSVTPIHTVGDTDTTVTFYDGIRVPVDNVVGEVNGGWRLITNQLNHERVGLAALGGRVEQLYADVVAWCATTPAGPKGSEHLIDQPWVQTDLARCHARLEAMKLLNWKMAAAVASGDLTAADSSASKVYGTECQVEVYRLLLGILGGQGTIRPGEPAAVLRGEAEQGARAAQINTFGGGVNDVQRDIVAYAGLGMTRTARRQEKP
ncbi:acyl-CoA dehydrogenase family protein [Rhabdothermincola salaria]|uniref:acyl-CoA dehydrogenase family protein n=1 Tax=Rhabdothermincola salaria TaxID=2903142 RepID=UPI001E44B838|nr:acyl-CoA dehydrogenase family protein [Rhabdothermincola salaria]MCD9623624.1 acyl-CoA dehydrogenase family protein [Rhabdothermincola salaria]